MTISTVVTRGFGSFGSVNNLPTLGYDLGAPIVASRLYIQVAAVYVPGAFASAAFIPGPQLATAYVPGAQAARISS